MNCFKELKAGARKCYTLYRQDKTNKFLNFLQCNGVIGTDIHLIEKTLNIVTCDPNSHQPLFKYIPKVDEDGDTIWKYVLDKQGKPKLNPAKDIPTIPNPSKDLEFIPNTQVPNPTYCKDNIPNPLFGFKYIPVPNPDFKSYLPIELSNLPFLTEVEKISDPLEVPTCNATILSSLFGFSLPTGGALVEYKDCSIVDNKSTFAYYGLDSYAEFRKIYKGCYLLFIYDKPLKKLECFSEDDVKTVCLLVDCPLKG